MCVCVCVYISVCSCICVVCGVWTSGAVVMHIAHQDVSKEIAANIAGSEPKKESTEEASGEPATKRPRSDPCKNGYLFSVVIYLVCLLHSGGVRTGDGQERDRVPKV